MKLTSIDTFRRIEAEGLVRKLRLKALRFIAYNPDATSLDAYYDPMFKGRRYTSVCPRFTELEQMGLIAVAGKVTQEGSTRCKYRLTGRIVPRKNQPIKSLETKRLELDRLFAQRERINKKINSLQTGVNRELEHSNLKQGDFLGLLESKEAPKLGDGGNMPCVII